MAKGAAWSIAPLHKRRSRAPWQGRRTQNGGCFYATHWRPSLLDLTKEPLDVRIICLELREAGRVAHRLFLTPQIAHKTRGRIKTLAIIGMVTKDIAKNLHGLRPIAGAGYAHGVDTAKMGALGCEIGRLLELGQLILLGTGPYEPKAKGIVSRRRRRLSREERAQDRLALRVTSKSPVKVREGHRRRDEVRIQLQGLPEFRLRLARPAELDHYEPEL